MKIHLKAQRLFQLKYNGPVHKMFSHGTLSAMWEGFCMQRP